MTSTAPIGVFDSGLGGITVVREIAKDLPNEQVLYFGDSANAPYGTKTPEQVRKLAFAIVNNFIREGVKAVVIACNTATSAAVDALRERTERLGIKADAVTRASIYLDGGIEAASAFIDRFWRQRMNNSEAARRDSKTELQEWAHANRLGTPRYREKERTGPDHDPLFTVAVDVPGRPEATGTGRSKRTAEQAAANALLVREGVWKPEEEA